MFDFCYIFGEPLDRYTTPKVVRGFTDYPMHLLSLLEDGTRVESGIHGGYAVCGGIQVVCEAL